jgi:hypothetical protein
MAGMTMKPNPVLLRKIKENLEKGLCPELKTHSILAAHGWDIDFGYNYSEAGSSKPKRISMKAARVMHLERKNKCFASVHFHLFITVKKSRKPWVVTEKSNHKQKTCCAWNNLIFARNLPDKPGRFAHPLNHGSLLAHNRWEGATVHEALRKDHWNIPFQDFFSAVCRAGYSHIHHRQGNSPKTTVTNDLFAFPCELHLALPLVIFDGRLFRAAFHPERKIADWQLEILPINFAAFHHCEEKEPFDSQRYRVDLSTLEHLNHYLALTEMRQKAVCSRIEFLAEQNCGIPANPGWITREKDKTARQILLEYLETVGEDPEAQLTKEKFLERAFDIKEKGYFLDFNMIRRQPALGALRQNSGYMAAYSEHKEHYSFDSEGIALGTRVKGDKELFIDNYDLLAEDIVQVDADFRFVPLDDGSFQLETINDKYPVASLEEARQHVESELSQTPYMHYLKFSLREFDLPEPEREETCRELMDCITRATFNFLEEAWVDMLNEFGLDPEETG